MFSFRNYKGERYIQVTRKGKIYVAQNQLLHVAADKAAREAAAQESLECRAEFDSTDNEDDCSDTIPLVADFGNSDSEPEFDDLKSKLDQFLYEEVDLDPDKEKEVEPDEKKEDAAMKDSDEIAMKIDDTENTTNVLNDAEKISTDPPRAESKLEDAFADFDTISADIGTTIIDNKRKNKKKKNNFWIK